MGIATEKQSDDNCSDDEASSYVDFENNTLLWVPPEPENDDDAKQVVEEQPGPSEHKSITVSLSSRCVWKGSVCERPHLLRIEYGGSFDKPLGRFLRDHLFDQAQAVYPYPDPYYKSIFADYDTQPYPAQPYPTQPMVHVQLMGIHRAGVLLPSEAIEEHVFVSTKQYHGIMRHRQSHAKAESENKLAKSRKSYLHESRHLRAVRRARRNGGRFQKKNDNNKKEVESSEKSQENINLQ